MLKSFRGFLFHYLGYSKVNKCSGQVETVYTWNQQQYIRSNLVMSNNTERLRWLKNSLNLNNVKLADINFSDPGMRTHSYRMTYAMDAPGFATQTGSRLFLPVNALNRWKLTLPENDGRQTDLYLPFTYADSDTTEIRIPDGYEIESLPKLAEVDSEYIEYHSELQLKDLQTLVYRRFIAFKTTRIPREAYGEVRDLFQEIYSADRQKIVLRESD